jgi:hypothetical protein
MIPRTDPDELALDESIEQDIDAWVEAKPRDPEQQDFEFDET